MRTQRGGDGHRDRQRAEGGSVDQRDHAAPSTAVYGTSFSVAATATAGLVSFSSGGVCLNIGDSFTMTSGTGTCTVKYDQAGRQQLQRRSPGDRDGDRGQGRPVDHGHHACSGQCGQGSQFTVAASGGGSSNPVVYSSSGGCSNSGATFTMTSGTTACSVMYDQAGDDNYNAAPEVTETVNAGQGGQAITVTTQAPSSAVYGSQFTVAATGGGSGNPVTFSSTGGCSNSGATFTMTSGTTACLVKYDQAGNANYSAAPTVTETVNAQKAGQSITVTTHAPGSAVYQAGFSVAATGGASGNAITFSSGRLLELGRLVHDDERHGQVQRRVRPGRRQQVQRRADGDRDRQREQGYSGDHRHDACAGQRGLPLRLRGRRDGRCVREPGDVLEQWRLLELGRLVHDDERHDCLPGEVRPGRGTRITSLRRR